MTDSQVNWTNQLHNIASCKVNVIWSKNLSDRTILAQSNISGVNLEVNHRVEHQKWLCFTSSRFRKGHVQPLGWYPDLPGPSVALKAAAKLELLFYKPGIVCKISKLNSSVLSNS